MNETNLNIFIFQENLTISLYMNDEWCFHHFVLVVSLLRDGNHCIVIIYIYRLCCVPILLTFSTSFCHYCCRLSSFTDVLAARYSVPSTQYSGSDFKFSIRFVFSICFIHMTHDDYSVSMSLALGGLCVCVCVFTVRNSAAHLVSILY